MKLVLIAEQCGANNDYVEAARQAGWELVAELDYGRFDAVFPGIVTDAVVLISQQVDDRILQMIRGINNTRPVPVVLYTADALQQSIRAAVSAGVAAYVVDCRNAGRLGALLDVAMVRFSESRQLQQELHRAKLSLAERSTVEKAKGIIMRQRSISEDAAYKLLRKLAMDRNRRIGEVAGEVIAAAEVLI